MKRSIFMAAVAIALAVGAQEANAQGLLKGMANKAKEKIEKKVGGVLNNAAGKVLAGKEKVETTVAKANGKIDNAIRLKEAYGKHDGFYYTATGVYDGDVDPFQLKAEELAAPDDPDNVPSLYNSHEIEADEVAYSSISEAVKAFPTIPTVQQMLTQDEAPVKALINFKEGANNYMATESARLMQSNAAAKKKIAAKKGIAGGLGAQMGGAPMQIVQYMQQHGIDPSKANDKEMEAMLKKAIESGELQLGGAAAVGGAVDVEYSEEQNEAIDKLSAKIDAIQEKTNASIGGIDPFGIKKKMDALYAELQAAWVSSNEFKQVVAIEKDIDKRAWDYLAVPKNAEAMLYPDEWVKGRKQENEIINKFNTQLATKWQKALQEIYDKNFGVVKEIAEANEELEAAFEDKMDIIYNTLKQRLSSELMQWMSMADIVVSRSYSAPLVSNVPEDKAIPQ